MKVTVVGEGAWGTAVATLLAENGHDVLVWCYNESSANEINNIHQNRRYMPGIILSHKIKATCLIKEAIEYSDYIFEAIPVKFLRGVLLDSKQFISENQKWIALSKGIESDSLLFPTQMFKEIFEDKTINSAVSGPSFAQELIKKDLTAVNCASQDLKIANDIVQIMNNNYFRACVTTDLIGIQVSAALKNVITLGVGLALGAEVGDNTIAMIITVGMNEIAMLVEKMGGRVETAYGLAGLGDLILTSTGKFSKNLEVGKRLGRGQSLEKIIHETGYIPEGINTVKSVFKLSKKYDISLPLCTGVFHIINGSRTIHDLLPNLFNCLAF
jgi:glycerol-3-phosphate dehydrogenase (NAD(P)+)